MPSAHDTSQVISGPQTCSLVILRHAKSSWKDPTLTDFQRPLNRRGERDAPFMAQRIRHHDLMIDEILCSPSMRTQLTLALMNDQLNVETERITMIDELYHASLQNLISLLSTRSARAVMLIGHNPGLKQLADLLSQGEIQRLPTCAYAAFRVPFQSWIDFEPHREGWTGAELTIFEFPKMFPRGQRRSHR